jgi:hypothetical protein
MSWEMPPTALRELGWLSPEQNKLVGNRLGDGGAILFALLGCAAFITFSTPRHFLRRPRPPLCLLNCKQHLLSSSQQQHVHVRRDHEQFDGRRGRRGGGIDSDWVRIEFI